LAEVGLDADLWRWTLAQIGSKDDVRRYHRAALTLQQAARPLPFVILSGDRGGREHTLPQHRSQQPRLEIGWTWVAKTGSARR